jgi:AraC family carnitine catabolism transcriptional activator
MATDSKAPLTILVIVMPNFNLAATVAFIDPFRAANYLEGRTHFRWGVASIPGGAVVASNGMTLETKALSAVQDESPNMVIVSSSWAPEAHGSPMLHAMLRRWARAGATLGALDTGAFILASLRLLTGRRATVHYEHLDAFKELHPDIKVSDQLFVFDGDRITCCGGGAAVDFALHIIRHARGETLANSAARYLFHERLRPQGARQNPFPVEPLGSTVPITVRKAVQVMEEHLETALPIPHICQRIGISQRQLDRLFLRYVRQSPALYYRDIRLDRARGLVTQTEISLSKVAVASGFSSQVHFSRAYRERFGIAPRRDRIEGRIPFEFRAWPLHHPEPAVTRKRIGRRAKKVKK